MMKMITKMLWRITVFMLSGLAVLASILMVCPLFHISFRTVHTSDDIGVASYDGKYRLVEMADTSQQYLLYSVIRLMDIENGIHAPETLFVTDDWWYLSMYISSYGWLNESYDFYIDSTDTGRTIYRYDGGTWHCEQTRISELVTTNTSRR